MAPSLEDRIEQLRTFEAEHGHMMVPVSHKQHGLGRWVNNKRTEKGNGKLKSEVIDQLDKVGFVWKVPKGPEKDKLIEWGKQFNWLVKFHASKGHCNVPSKIAGKVVAVAAWSDEQRQLHTEGKLDQGKFDKLTRLGFDFYGSSSADDDDEEEEEKPAMKKKRQRTDQDEGKEEAIEVLQKKIEQLEREIKKLRKENKHLKAEK